MKLFVWDLHGVMEKGNDYAVLEINNQVLEEFGFQERFTLEECFRLAGIRWYEYFEYKLPNETYEQWIQLQNRCFEISNNEFHRVIKHATANDHLHEILAKIATKHHQILISSTRPESMPLYLKAIDAERYFSPETTFPIDTHKADVLKTKKHILKDFLERQTKAGISYEEIIIIGDSPADIALVEVAGGITYLYAHKERAFRDCIADHKIRDLREVLKEV